MFETILCLLPVGFLLARPRRPSPPDGVSGLRYPRCTPPTSTFFHHSYFFLLTFAFPFANFFSFFLFFFFAYLYLHIFLFLFFYAYLYVFISPHFRSTTASIATNFPSVRMLACAFFFSLFCTVYAWLHTFLLLDTLACTFSFLFLFSLFCMHTLAYIFNFTKCICLPDVMYFFCVYLYVCILLLEVYIQGCIFIYKNAYLKRTCKKKKCIHYVAHFFLPAAAGRILKMYTHACTHKKPSQRAGYISKNAYICRHIFSVVLCIHMHTLFSSSPNFAGILPQQAYPQKYQKNIKKDISEGFPLLEKGY